MKKKILFLQEYQGADVMTVDDAWRDLEEDFYHHFQSGRAVITMLDLWAAGKGLAQFSKLNSNSPAALEE